MLRSLALAVILAIGFDHSAASADGKPVAVLQSRPIKSDANAARKRVARLAAARSWGYQLRITDLAPLKSSPFDLLVIDHGYAATREGKRLFAPAEIAGLKKKPNGRRRPVVAYLSIGEAEQYRFYWKANWKQPATAPDWLGPENTEWGGNFIVRFWHPEWQRIMFGAPDAYLESLMAQGFDGVFLDRVDVYEEVDKERPTAERDMIAFVTALARHARKINPHFLVIMQNAEGLLSHRSIRRAIDGLGKEDLLYGIEHTAEANPAASIAYSVRQLRKLKRTGRPVFAVEYVDAPTKIRGVRRRYARLGLVAYFGPRNLDMLILDPLKITRPFDIKPTPEQLH